MKGPAGVGCRNVDATRSLTVKYVSVYCKEALVRKHTFEFTEPLNMREVDVVRCHVPTY